MAAKTFCSKYLQILQTKFSGFGPNFLSKSKNTKLGNQNPSWEVPQRGFSSQKWKKAKLIAAFGISGGLALVPVVTGEVPSSPIKNYRKEHNFIADVVEHVASAVVCIEVKSMRFFSVFPPNGSGFIVKDDGLILTNAHVVMNRLNSTVQIKLEDGRTFQGVVEDIDMKSDLATVRIKASRLPVMKLGSSSEVRPGEWVVAIGSPLSLSNSITTGVISSPNRRSDEIGIPDRNMEYIQTDAAITFGNSGGPLVNLEGEAIGINCMKIAGGISFAIPIDYAKEFLKKLEDKQNQAPAFAKSKYTGVTVFSLNHALLQEMKFGDYHVPEEVTTGLLVGKVVHGSPAHKSGLKTGDVVTHINSVVVEDVNSIYTAVETGEPLKITVIRNGVYKNLIVVPEDAAPL